jgi:starch synthase
MRPQPEQLRVLFIASEAEPFIKVGGLGDVAGSLPKALRKFGEENQKLADIRLVIPYHNAINKDNFQLSAVTAFDIPYRGGVIPAEVYDTDLDGLPVYLISGSPFIHTQQVYSGDPELDGKKFTFFSLAALQLARALDWPPDLLHANDWHTAPAVYALSSLYKDETFFSHTKTLITIHNLPYLGVGAGDEMRAFGISPAVDSALPWWAQDLPLPLGLLAADHIVAVSKTYAQEILTPEFGSGLYDFLRTRADTISGIINGLDLVSWNPEDDPHLPSNFGINTVADRQLNKHVLQTELELEANPEAFLMGMVTRLDNQKGVDLAFDAIQELESLEGESEGTGPWQFVILGTGLSALEETALKMQEELPTRVRSINRFDAALSRKIYAGADALLIPSRYEPCGLTQMIAMRYGCVPIARATGGLQDTIADFEGADTPTGFLFSKAEPEHLLAAIQRARKVFNSSDTWQSLQKNGMVQDFSWDRSALEYLNLYHKLSEND